MLFMKNILYVPDTIYLFIRIKPKKKYSDSVLHLLYESIAPTHKEQGCLEYKILREEETILILGRWENKMSLDMHLLFQYHLALFEETLPPLCKKISIKVFDELEPPITALSVS
jgi:quinol monooxygenase YgiN